MVSVDVLLVAGGNIAIVGWCTQQARIWWWGVAWSIACFTWSHVHQVKHDPNLNVVSLGRPPECCLPACTSCSAADARDWTCGLRIIAGIAAVMSAIFSLYTGNTETLSVLWSCTVGLWIMSCIPMVVTLFQCAAVPSSSSAVHHYRAVVTIWMLHDLLLGGFWMYLATTLQNMEDDSEWCKILMSMFSWHIVVLVVRTFFVRLGRQIKKEPGPCCGPQAVIAWWRALQFLSMVNIYLVVVERVRQHQLRDMGCSAAAAVAAGFSVGALVFSRRCLLVATIPTIATATTPRSSGTVLDF